MPEVMETDVWQSLGEDALEVLAKGMRLNRRPDCGGKNKPLVSPARPPRREAFLKLAHAMRPRCSDRSIWQIQGAPRAWGFGLDELQS